MLQKSGFCIIAKTALSTVWDSKIRMSWSFFVCF
jgi:hypothetical protein